MISDFAILRTVKGRSAYYTRRGNWNPDVTRALSSGNRDFVEGIRNALIVHQGVSEDEVEIVDLYNRK